MNAAAGAAREAGGGGRGLAELLAPSARRGGGAPPLLEDALSFALLAAAQFAVALSIADASWVDEMPSLPAAAAIGLVSGTLLARRRPLPAALALCLAIGLAAAAGMVMHTMELADPQAGGGIAERWGELRGRMGDWLAALFGGGVSTDPLPFVLLLVFAVWLVPALAAWAVFRWRNAWLALLPGGFALLTNISYLPGKPAFWFVVFLFSAILLFARIHLLRTVRGWQGREVAAPPWISLQALHAGAWLALALLAAAWLLPAGGGWAPASAAWSEAVRPIADRAAPFGQVFIGIDGKRAQLVHQFENALPLQGRVRLDEEPMYVVTAEAGAASLLRAGAFDRYGRGGWRLSGADRAEPPALTVEAARFGTPATRASLRLPVAIEVRVEAPLSDRRLLTAGEPLASDVDAEFLTGASDADVIGLRPRSRAGSGARYATVGTVSAADAEMLIRAGGDYPAWVRERYLQLPDSLPDRVRGLAAGIAGDAGIPYVAAFQVERYLRNNYAYDLRVEDQPPRSDAVDHFLFGSRAGYFDHFASAMAVMLRAIGVPARVAVGFALGPSSFDEATRTYVLSEADSWAWPEVWFPGFGWVEFNPTPGRGAVTRPGPDAVSFIGPGAGLEELDLFGAIPADELEEQLRALEDAGFAAGAAADSGGGAGAGAPIPFAILGWLLAIAAGAAALVLAARGAWAYPTRGLAPATARWAKVQRLSGWAGLGAPPHRTPFEAARDLRRGLETEQPVELLAGGFTRERYGPGGAPAGPDDAGTRRADAVYVRLRNRLVREALLRRLGLRRRPR